MPDIKQSLRDFVATSNSGKYKTEEELMSKFPELKGYNVNSLRDYVATANSGKYNNEDEINAKFPELFSEDVKKKVPTPDLSGAVVGAGSGIQNISPLESTSASGISEINQEQVDDLTYANVPDITKGVFKGNLQETIPISQPEQFPLELGVQKQQPSTLEQPLSTTQQNILAQQHGAIAPVEQFLSMPLDQKLITIDQNKDLEPTLLKNLNIDEKKAYVNRKQQQAVELIPTVQSNFINPILKLGVEPIEFQAAMQMFINNTISDNPEALKEPKALYDFTQKTKGLMDDVFKSNEDLYRGTVMETMPEKMQAVGSIVPYLVPIGAPAKIVGGIATKAVIEGLPKFMIDASVMGMSGFNQGFTAAKDKIEEINKYDTKEEAVNAGIDPNDYTKFHGKDPITQAFKAGAGTASSSSMMAIPLFLQWMRGAKIGGSPFKRAIDKTVSDVKGAETLLTKANSIYENSGKLITPLIKSGAEFAGIGAGMSAISSFTAQQLYNSSTSILEDVANGLSDSFAMGVMLGAFHPVLEQRRNDNTLPIKERVEAGIAADNIIRRAEQIDAQKTSETAPEPKQQSPEVVNLESQKNRLIESLNTATNETVKEVTIKKLEELDTQIENQKIADSENKATQELTDQTIVELEKKRAELEAAKSESPEEVVPEIEKQQAEIDNAITDLRGKKITPQPEVKTDIETVKKELNLTRLESELYDTFKDVKPEEYENNADLYTEKLKELINKSDDRTTKLEKQLEEIDTRRTNIDEKIDEINSKEEISEKDKLQIKKLEKEYKGLDKTEKQLKQEIADESKHNDELFSLPDDGSGIQDILNKVNARLQTRQQVNQGSDLFPETANIKELKLQENVSQDKERMAGNQPQAETVISGQSEQGTGTGETQGDRNIQAFEKEIANGDWEKGENRDFYFDPNSTKSEGRFRLYPPNELTKYFRRKSTTNGVSYVIGKDSNNKEVIQAIRFDKGKFTEEQAKEWFEKNKNKYKFYKSDKFLPETESIIKEIKPESKDVNLSKIGIKTILEEAFPESGTAEEVNKWIENNVQKEIETNLQSYYDKSAAKKDNIDFNKNVSETISRVIEEGKGDTQDLADILVYVTKLRNEKNDLRESLKTKDSFLAKERLSDIDIEMSNAILAARNLGRQSSTIFRMLQVMAKEDYSYGGIKERVSRYTKDGKLSEEQDRQIKEVSDKLEAANIEIERLKKETIENGRDAVISILIKEAKLERKRQNRKITQEEISASNDRIKKLIEDAKKTKSNLNDISTVATDASKLIYGIAKEYAGQGITNAKLIVKNIAVELNNAGYSFTEDQINEALANFQKETKDSVVKKIRETKTEKENTKKDIKELPTKEKILLQRKIRLEKELANLEKGITKNEREKVEDSEQTIKLKEEIQNKKEELGLIVAKELPKLKTEKEYNEQRIKQVDKNLLELRRKFDTGNFRKPEYNEWGKNETLKKKISEYEQLKEQADVIVEKQRLQSRHWFDKAIDNVSTAVFDVPRMLMTTADASFIGKQTLLTSLNPRHADITLKAMKSLKQTFNQKRFDEAQYYMKQMPEYKDAKKHGVKFMEKGVREMAQDDVSKVKFLEQIPGLGFIIKSSNRSYAAYVNTMRLEHYLKWKNYLEKSGISKEQFEKDLKDASEIVNNITGTANLGKAEQMSPLLNKVFFAARLFTSRFKTITKPFDPRLSKEVRLNYVKDMGAWTRLMGSIYSALFLGGADIETDPRSSNWMKIKVNNKYIDPLGGYIQIIRTIAQFATGEKKTAKGDIQKLGEYGKDTRFDVALNFFTNKLSPLMGYAVKAARSKENRPFNATEEAIKLAVPMNIMSTIEYLSNEDPEMLDALLLGLSEAGVGVNYQPELSDDYIKKEMEKRRNPKKEEKTVEEKIKDKEENERQEELIKEYAEKYGIEYIPKHKKQSHKQNSNSIDQKIE